MGSPVGWKALLADAILYAREGFQASDGQRVPPPREPDLFTERAPTEIRRALWPLYHPDALRRGPLVQRDLARTLEAVRDGGAEGFYHGDVARRLVAAAAAVGSPLAVEDLAEHRSDWMEPLRVAYAEGHVASFPPPTQGISALAVLGMTERFDMSALPEADYIHVLVEATKLAFDDRDRYLTDPAHMRVNPVELLAPERLQARARLISRERARPPQPAAAAGGDTIALVTADREGNAVSADPVALLHLRRGGARRRHRRGAAEPRLVLLARSRPRQRARSRQADDAHADPVHVPRGRAAALRLRDHGRRGPAPDPGRHPHPPPVPAPRPAGRDRGTRAGSTGAPGEPRHGRSAWKGATRRSSRASWPAAGTRWPSEGSGTISSGTRTVSGWPRRTAAWSAPRTRERTAAPSVTEGLSSLFPSPLRGEGRVRGGRG